METPGGAKFDLINSLSFLTELSDLRLSSLEETAPCLFGQMYLVSL